MERDNPTHRARLSTDEFARTPEERKGEASDGNGSAPTPPGAPAPAAGEPTRSGARGTAARRTEEPPGDPAPHTSPHADAEDEESQRLLTPDDEDGFRARWREIQNRFVDDPPQAVDAADGLVADVMQRLAETFADHKHGLEEQWKRGEQADTEELRLALRHYRSFFNRLLVT
ncbi:hypothetical protein ACWCP6_24885 [Streptomyces sp. NPDC002004]